MNPHEQAGLANAVALVAKAAAATVSTADDGECAGYVNLYADVDGILNGDDARETLMGVASYAGMFVDMIARLRMESHAQVLDCLAAWVSESIFEERED